MTTDVLIPNVYADLLKPARYKCVFGGRGSGKSWTIASLLVMMAAEKPLRILCTRELQVSIDDSVLRLLADTIARLGLENRFQILRDEIRGANGSLFIFEGLRFNVKRIKSLEGVQIAWTEEADAVSNESLNLLVPTVRAKDSELWFSFNRDRPDDPCYERFVKNARPGSVVIKTLYSDNPWCPAVLRDEAQWDAANDAERYSHVWLGEPWSRSDSLVFKDKYSIEPFHTPPDADFLVGCDFGFSSDPLALTRCFIGEGNILYIDAEAVGYHVEVGAMPAMLDAVLPHRQWLVKADSSRPELISYLNGLGYRVEGSRKGAGSVEDGLAYLLSFAKIIVHPRCKHVADELGMFSYKVDRMSGVVQPVVADKHNHTIDALRYSCEDIYRPKYNVLQVPEWSLGEIGL